MAIAFDRDSKTYQRIKNSYKNERLKKFDEINTTYGLALPKEWLEREAEAYGRYKADSEVFLFSELDPFSMIMFAVGATLTAIFTIMFPPVGWLGWTIFGVSIGAQAGTIALTMTQQGFLDQVASFTYAQTQNTTLQSDLTKNAMQKQSGQLSDFLVFNPYAICATGSVYESGAPGSESFTYAKAYDPTQGLRGDYDLSPFDEQVQNRAQKFLAGNQSFDSVQNPLPIPRAKAQLDFSSEQQGIKSHIKLANEDINEGYMKLSKEFFGFFENGKHIESYYEHSVKKRITPLKNRYRQNDFLEKQKNYAKGLRADFFYETLKEKHLSLEERQKILEETLKYYKDKLEAMAGDKISQGAIFLELAVSFVQMFYKTYGELESLDFVRDYKNPFANLGAAEIFFYQGVAGILQDGSLKTIRQPYFISFYGKINGIDRHFSNEDLAQRTRKIYFRDEEIVKDKLKLDFYAMGWREILQEFDFIASHLLKLPYPTYHVVFPRQQTAYWTIFMFIKDDKIFDYHITYEIDTPSAELFLRIRERKPQLTDAQWEQAFKVYTGFFDNPAR